MKNFHIHIIIILLFVSCSDELDEAKKLIEENKTSEALFLISQIKPDDEKYSKGQDLIKNQVLLNHTRLSKYLVEKSPWYSYGLGSPGTQPYSKYYFYSDQSMKFVTGRLSSSTEFKSDASWKLNIVDQSINNYDPRNYNVRGRETLLIKFKDNLIFY